MAVLVGGMPAAAINNIDSHSPYYYSNIHLGYSHEYKNNFFFQISHDSDIAE